jgi:proteic killer suppression protein
VIKSFKGKHAEAVFKGQCPKGFPANLVKVARRKLLMVHAAKTLEDLRVPPANHLEALKGDLIGKYSIRVNAQWRVVFIWDGDGGNGVEIVDYR